MIENWYEFQKDYHNLHLLIICKDETTRDKDKGKQVKGSYLVQQAGLPHT